MFLIGYQDEKQCNLEDLRKAFDWLDWHGSQSTVHFTAKASISSVGGGRPKKEVNFYHDSDNLQKLLDILKTYHKHPAEMLYKSDWEVAGMRFVGSSVRISQKRKRKVYDLYKKNMSFFNKSLDNQKVDTKNSIHSLMKAGDIHDNGKPVQNTYISASRIELETCSVSVGSTCLGENLTVETTSISPIDNKRDTIQGRKSELHSTYENDGQGRHSSERNLCQVEDKSSEHFDATKFVGDNTKHKKFDNNLPENVGLQNNPIGRAILAEQLQVSQGNLCLSTGSKESDKDMVLDTCKDNNNILSSKNLYETEGSKSTDNKGHLHLEKQSPVILNYANVGSDAYDPPDNKNVENKHPYDSSNESSGNSSTSDSSSGDEKEESWHSDDKSSLISIPQEANREHSYNFNKQKDHHRQLNEAENISSMRPYDSLPVGRQHRSNDAKFVGVICQEIVLGALREREYQKHTDDLVETGEFLVPAQKKMRMKDSDILTPESSPDTNDNHPYSGELVKSLSMSNKSRTGKFEAEMKEKSFKYDMGNDWRKLPVESTRNGRSFSGNYMNYFSNIISKFNERCCWGFKYNRIKKIGSRNINLPFFHEKAYCTFQGCQMSVDLFIRNEEVNFLELDFDGKITHTEGKTNARRFIKDEKEKLYKFFEENPKTPPYKVFRERLRDLSSEAYTSGNQTGVGKTAKALREISRKSKALANSPESIILKLFPLHKKLQGKMKKKPKIINTHSASFLVI